MLPSGIRTIRDPTIMATRQPKKLPRDPNQRAKAIVDIVTGEADDETMDVKNQAAVELGRRGGLKGGKARAAKLTPEQRKEAGVDAKPAEDVPPAG